MGLLSTNIAKLKRLSLLGIKLPPPKIEEPELSETIKGGEEIQGALFTPGEEAEVVTRYREPEPPSKDITQVVALARDYYNGAHKYTPKELKLLLQAKAKVSPEIAEEAYSIMIQEEGLPL